MTTVITARAVPVDGYLGGRTPDGTDEVGRGLGDAPMRVDWYVGGDTPSRVFDALDARVGAIVAGHTASTHSGHVGGGSPHPTAPLFVVGHGPVPETSGAQTLVTTGVADAVELAGEAAGAKAVGLTGGAVATAALAVTR